MLPLARDSRVLFAAAIRARLVNVVRCVLSGDSARDSACPLYFPFMQIK